MAREILIGDAVFTKNNTEIYGTVEDVDGNNITVSYNTKCEEDCSCIVNDSTFTDSGDGDCWYLPNWTLD